MSLLLDIVLVRKCIQYFFIIVTPLIKNSTLISYVNISVFLFEYIEENSHSFHRYICS